MKLLTLLTAFTLQAFAGGLYLEISQGMSGGLLTAKVTACHEPAKSVVTAHLVTMVDGQLKRQALVVVPVAGEAGVFAVTGQLPATRGIVELAVTNPQFKDYEPRVLIRSGAGKVEIATKKHFFSISPKLADYRQALAD